MRRGTAGGSAVLVMHRLMMAVEVELDMQMYISGSTVNLDIAGSTKSGSPYCWSSSLSSSELASSSAKGTLMYSSSTYCTS